MTEEVLLEKVGYREAIIAAVKNDANHPINHNIKMQAHHLVSAKGVQLARLGARLEQLGYNINVLENLVLLPSTLQGACHLKVQLHRGDHKYTDDDHPLPYHHKVRVLMEELKDLIEDCSGCGTGDSGEKTRRRIQRRVDKVSKAMLDRIATFRIPLTSIYRSFDPENATGCCGSDSVGKLLTGPCPVDRNHKGQQGDGQATERITFNFTRSYQLRVGQ